MKKADYIITLRGRFQSRTRILRTKLDDSQALAIERALYEALDSGYLLQGDMQAVMLMKETKPGAMIEIIKTMTSLAAVPIDWLEEHSPQAHAD